MTSPTSEASASNRRRARRKGSLALIRTGLEEMFGRRRLTRFLVGADIKRTHADTLFGQLWWIIDPLLQMAVYIILVTIIFARPTPDYPLFIFAAILPWKWFSTSLNDATLSVTGRQLPPGSCVRNREGRRAATRARRRRARARAHTLRM